MIVGPAIDNGETKATANEITAEANDVLFIVPYQITDLKESIKK